MVGWVKVGKEDKLTQIHMRLNLLFVIDNLQFGGGERVFAQIIKGLPPEKYKIFLASCPGKQFHQAIETRWFQFFPTDFSKRLNFSLISRLLKIIKKHEINIVHGQGARAEFHARIASWLAGKSKYVSTIAMPVEGFDVGPVRKKIYTLFDRFSEKFVDRFLVVSDVLRDKMIRGHGIPAEKVIKIYNGIEIDHYTPQGQNGSRERIRNEFNIGRDTLFIGAIGRLVWQKGFEHLVQAMQEVLKEIPPTKVLIVGEGPLRNDLEGLARKLKIERDIIFAGFRKDVEGILSAIDVLVVPSLLEGFPMITLEGMAVAKPIIATRIDGIKEQIVDAESGILIPPGDPDAIAEAILRLNADKELAQSLGLEGRRRVEKEFTVERMVSETEKVYQSLYEQR
jgi:glycosyltransferase involved in cell wall biosynthesis